MSPLERIIGVGLIVLTLGGWVTTSYFEMKAFNKFSEQKATLVDAMFAKLRIMAK